MLWFFISLDDGQMIDAGGKVHHVVIGHGGQEHIDDDGKDNDRNTDIGKTDRRKEIEYHFDQLSHYQNQVLKDGNLIGG